MTTKSKYTPENIESLEPNQIFVFGSNLNGEHGGGAAYIAYKKFGARMGVGFGTTGQCYALPTLDKQMKRFDADDLEHGFIQLINTILWDDKNNEFLLTKVGCGIAGYSVDEVADALWSAVDKTQFDCAFELRNLVLPKEFIRSKEEKARYDIWFQFRGVDKKDAELFQDSYREAESQYNSFLENEH